MAAVRRNAPVTTLDSAEGNEVHALIPEPKALRWTVGDERSRGDEGLTRAEKRIPIAHSQRQIRVLRGPPWLRAMRVNEEEAASGGSDQDGWYIPCCLAHG